MRVYTSELLEGYSQETEPQEELHKKEGFGYKVTPVGFLVYISRSRNCAVGLLWSSMTGGEGSTQKMPGERF